MRRALLAVVAVFALGACRHAVPPNGIEFLTPYGPPRYPFSPAVRVGNLLFLAGQIGTDSSGRLSVWVLDIASPFCRFERPLPPVCGEAPAPRFDVFRVSSRCFSKPRASSSVRRE